MASLLLLTGCSALLTSGDVESQAHRAVEDLARQGVRFDAAQRPVRLDHIEISEITVDGRDPPRALFHVIASGTFGLAQVGYYGSEHVAFKRAGGRLAPPDQWLPKLQGVLTALAAAPNDASAVLSIRVDGDRAEVSLLSPAGRRTASLVQRGDSWRFTSGLL